MADKYGYGPQDEEYYAKQKADFEKEHPSGETKPRSKRRSGPSRLVSPPPTRSAGDVTPNPKVIVQKVRVGGNSEEGEYYEPSYQTHVFIALAFSIIIVGLSAVSKKKLGVESKGSNFLESVSGWVVIIVVLVALARFEGTAKFAAAFAWLIFVAVLLINGEQALAFINTNTTSTPATGIGSGGGRAKP